MASIQHPECTLAASECRIVKTEYETPPATPWVAVYDGDDQLMNADPTVYVEGYSCATCSRAWEQHTVGEDTTLVDLPPAPQAPVNIDIPYAAQEAGELTCTMGNWAGEPVNYGYEWVRDGSTRIGAGARYTFTPDLVGQHVTCVVSATNSHGTTQAPPSNELVVEAVDERALVMRGGSPQAPGQGFGDSMSPSNKELAS